MENEIKVGEYVRLSRCQGINRIESIFITNTSETRYYLEDEIADEFGERTECLEESELKDDIVKHSENLIDLIEVGDYVNGNKVLSKYFNGQLDVLETTGEDTNDKCLSNKEIRTVVTHEQIEAISYKVKQEEN